MAHLERLATGMKVGGTASFRSKTSANRFAAILRRKGFRVEGIRSSGPVIEGGIVRRAFTVVITGKKRTGERKPRKKRRDTMMDILS